MSSQNKNETMEQCMEGEFEDCIMDFHKTVIDFASMWAIHHDLDLTDPEDNDLVRGLFLDLADNMPDAKEMKEILEYPHPKAEA